MIDYATSDIFAHHASAIVNPVNCAGAMGAGLALQFKRRYPACFPPYREACLQRTLRPGSVFIWPTGLSLPQWIVHFPTKRHWRDPSLLRDIEEGLHDLAFAIRLHRIPSIAVPPLGCGLGGLDWPSVRALIEATLSDLPCAVTVLRPASRGRGTAPRS